MRTLLLQNMVSSSAHILSQCKIRLNFKDTFSINANHGDWSDHSVVKKKNHSDLVINCVDFNCAERKDQYLSHILRQRNLRWHIMTAFCVSARNSTKFWRDIQHTVLCPHIEISQTMAMDFFARFLTLLLQQKIAVNVWEYSKVRYLIR